MNIVQFYKHCDPAARTGLEVVLLYPGLHAVISYRIAHFFFRLRLFFIARTVSQLSRFFTGIEIHPGATIGKALFIDHGSGIVIGETTQLGDYCMLYQGVTLGGTGKDTGKRHPTLGNDVLVGSGAKILGPVNIGSHAKIGAGAVVLEDIPRYATAVGVPARVVRDDNRQSDTDESPVSDIDWLSIPDPVAQELTRLYSAIGSLEDRLKQMEQNTYIREQLLAVESDRFHGVADYDAREVIAEGRTMLRSMSAEADNE